MYISSSTSHFFQASTSISPTADTSGGICHKNEGYFKGMFILSCFLSALLEYYDRYMIKLLW